jgi:predicted aspartyl protease
MGEFSVHIEVGNIQGHEYVDVEALVDTGATHSVFPASFLRDMGIEAAEKIDVKLGDGRIRRDVPLGFMFVRALGRHGPCLVMFGESDEFLLGATTLENLNLAVGPVHQELLPLVLRGHP